VFMLDDGISFSLKGKGFEMGKVWDMILTHSLTHHFSFIHAFTSWDTLLTIDATVDFALVGCLFWDS
jgi:hypothetical protein